MEEESYAFSLFDPPPGVLVDLTSGLTYLSLSLFVSTKFHFDETISLAGLVSLLFVVVDVDVPHLWKLCDGITFVILELHF